MCRVCLVPLVTSIALAFMGPFMGQARRLLADVPSLRKVQAAMTPVTRYTAAEMLEEADRLELLAESELDFVAVAMLRQAAEGQGETQALQDVRYERERQDVKWGEQNHDPFTYLTVLGEEFGELCQAALHVRFGGPAGEGLRKEAVQTAAMALAIVECLDRGKWSFRTDLDNNGNPLHPDAAKGEASK